MVIRSHVNGLRIKGSECCGFIDKKDFYWQGQRVYMENQHTVGANKYLLKE